MDQMDLATMLWFLILLVRVRGELILSFLKETYNSSVFYRYIRDSYQDNQWGGHHFYISTKTRLINLQSNLSLFDYCDLEKYTTKGIAPLLQHYNVNSEWIGVYDYQNTFTRDCLNLDTKTYNTLYYIDFLSIYLNNLEPLAVIEIHDEWVTYPYVWNLNPSPLRILEVPRSRKLLECSPNNCSITFPSIDSNPYELISTTPFLALQYISLSSNFPILLVILWQLRKIWANHRKKSTFVLLNISLITELIILVFRSMLASNIHSFIAPINELLIVSPFPLTIMSKFIILSIWFNSLRSIDASLNFSKSESFITTKAFQFLLIFYSVTCQMILLIVHLGQYFFIIKAPEIPPYFYMFVVSFFLGLLVTVFTFYVSILLKFKVLLFFSCDILTSIYIVIYKGEFSK